MPRVRTSTSTAIPPLELPPDPTIEADKPTIDAPPPDPQTAELVQANARAERAVEDLIARLARDENLSGDERLFLRQHAPPAETTSDVAFSKWLAGQVARLRSIQQLQSAAGSAADRQHAADDLQAARQRQAEQAPAIQEQIRRLQDQLATLAHAVAKCDNTVTRQDRAVEDLQKQTLLPQRIRESIQAVKRTNATDRAAFVKAEGRIKSLAGILALDPTDAYQREQLRLICGRETNSVLYNKIFPPHNGVSKINSDGGRDFCPEAWEQHKQVLRAELLDCQEVIEKLGPTNRRAAAEVAALRRYLVPQ